MILRRVAIGLAVIAALFPTGALAAAGKTTAPTKAERAAILEAFGDPAAASPCLNVRIAASNHKYGTVRFRTATACRRWAFNGVNVFKRAKHNHWRLVFAASAYKCPLARFPRSVQRDLGVCP